MAEKIQLKTAPKNDVADDDPFAELTRIMGFDPRQPARPQAKSAPAETPADFDIDLERELMGEFGANDDMPDGNSFRQTEIAAAPAARAPETSAELREPQSMPGRAESVDAAQAEIDTAPAAQFEAIEPEAMVAVDAGDHIDDGFAAELDQAFSFADEEQVPVAMVPEPVAELEPEPVAAIAPEPAAVAAPVEAAVQAAPEADFDDALAHEMQQAFQHVEDASDEPDPISALADVFVSPKALTAPVQLAPNVPAAEPLESELLSEEELAVAAYQPTVAAPAETRSTLDLDRSIAASLDDEFHAEEDFRIEPSALQRAASPEMDRTIMQSLEDEFQLDSDFPIDPVVAPPAALASRVQAGSAQPVGAHEEDFAGHFDAAMAEVDMDFDPRPMETRPMADSRAPAAAASDSHDDFAMNFDDIVMDERKREAAPQVQAARAPAVSHTAIRDERSLEDELNALLGKMGARTAPAVKESVMAQKPQAAVPAVAQTGRSDRANWGYATSTVATAKQVAERSAPQPSAADIDAMLLQELAAEGFDAADAGGKHGEIDFDEAAFDAAFARSIAMDDLGIEAAPRASTAAAAAEPSNWLASRRSLAPEPARTWDSGASTARQQPAPVAEPAYQGARADRRYGDIQAPAHDDMPDIDTVDVPERVVALADDLDIPEFSYEDDQASSPSYDDLDAEFSSLINEMNAADAAAAPSRNERYDDEAYESGFGHDRDRGARAYAEAPEPADTPLSYDSLDVDDRFADLDVENLPGSRPASRADAFGLDDADYDPEFDDEMSVPGLAQQEPRRSRGRGLLVAGIVCAVAVAGGIGAFALSFGGKGGTDAPVIVKADNAPIKIKPENPGGAVVPNQDSKVYDAVAKGAKPAAPVQQKLVTNTEEPVDVAAQPESRAVDISPDDSDALLPAPKAEDRIEEVLQQADDTTKQQGVVAVAPRKVRTMVVKPDGSLVPREDTEPAAAQVSAAEPADPAPQHVVNPDAQDQTGAVQAAPQKLAAPSADDADAQAAVKQADAKPASKAKAQSSVTPKNVPLAPQRPSDQPITVVGEVKPDQVASINPTAAPAAASGSWSMQIASQPTVENAQSTYQDLARRYASVLSGRGVNIVKAEIAGKGTFYRVRVPAQSRNDAISLCTSYKAAGGNCFVSK